MRKAEQQRRLDRNPGKDHWSVDDIFKNSQTTVAFTHRDYQIGLHTHEFIEVNLVTGGHGRHHMEDNELSTTRGDVFVIPPKVEHGYINEGGLDVFHILLHPLFVQRHAERLGELDGYLMLFTVEPFFRRRSGFRHGIRLIGEELKTAERLARWFDADQQSGGAEKDWALECLASYFVIHLCRCYASRRRMAADVPDIDTPHPHWRAVRSAMALVAKRCGQALTLDELARAACMQKNYFCRVFHSATGMTPMEYVQSERMREARRLLLKTDLSVSEIGSQLGFFDTAHFSKTFAQHVGAPPVRFRRKDDLRYPGE